MVIVLLVLAIASVGVLLLYRRWVENLPLTMDCGLVLAGEKPLTERWLHSPLPDSVFSLKLFPALY